MDGRTDGRPDGNLGMLVGVRALLAATLVPTAACRPPPTPTIPPLLPSLSSCPAPAPPHTRTLTPPPSPNPRVHTAASPPFPPPDTPMPSIARARAAFAGPASRRYSGPRCLTTGIDLHPSPKRPRLCSPGGRAGPWTPWPRDCRRTLIPGKFVEPYMKLRWRRPPCPASSSLLQSSSHCFDIVVLRTLVYSVTEIGQ
jgi:hypothetical protein